jgi:hypothetical protein
LNIEDAQLFLSTYVIKADTKIPKWGRSSATMEISHKYRPSLFFPVMLITVGIVWLLVNSGTVAAESVYRLIPYWPVLLILIGLSILLERVWWPLTGIMWVAAAGAVIWLLVAAPAFLPAAPALEMKNETLSEAVGSADKADVHLDLSINPVRIFPLDNSSDLIAAEVYYLGNMNFQVSGTTQKSIRLEQTTGGFQSGPRFDWVARPMPEWEIGLTQEIPLRLTVDASTGQTNVDLSTLQIESLKIDASTGRMNITLPQNNPKFPFALDASTGGIEIRVLDGTSVDMDIKASTGRLLIDVPDGAGVQLEVIDDGPGGLRLPNDFRKIREGGDSGEGVWENDAYASAAAQIRIVVDISTGTVEIR